MGKGAVVRSTVVLVALSLALSIVMLGNVERAAAQGSCAQGVQSGVTCEIEGDAPVAGVDGLTCMDPYELAGERCVRYELVDGIDLTCDVGTLLLDECVEVGPAPEPIGPPLCPTAPNMVFEDSGECYMLVPKVGGDTCPAGTTPDPGGLVCRSPIDKITQTINVDPSCPDGFALGVPGATEVCAQLEAALLAHPTCAPDNRGPLGGCYSIWVPPLTCINGTLVGTQCLIAGDPPVPGQSSCPVSAIVQLEGGFCYQLVPRPTLPLNCDSNSFDYNAAPYQLIAGQCQLLVDGIGFPVPAGGIDCPSVLGDGSSTVLTGVHQPDFDVSGAELIGPCVLEGTFFLACAIGDALDPNGVSCRTAVQLRSGTLMCAPTYGLINGQCFRYEAPVVSSTAPCPFEPLDAFGLCREPAEPRIGDLVCGEAAQILEGSLCVTRYDPTCDYSFAIISDCVLANWCPVGFVLIADLCQRTVPASQQPDACPQGARGVAGGCYILVAKGSDGCPLGSIEDGLANCRKPVANAAGAYYCPGPHAVLDGTACVSTTATLTACGYNEAIVGCRTSGSTCPDGYDVAASGLCEHAEPAIQTDVGCQRYTLGSPGACFAFVERISSIDGLFSACPGGSVEDGDGRCRVPRLDAPTHYYCENPGALLQGTQCLLTAGFSTSCTTAQAQSGQCGRPDAMTCPVGFSPDDALGGICVRFEPASQGPDVCPEGARGVPGDCYILVAKGPRSATCEEGSLLGNQCVVFGDPPVADQSGFLTCAAGFGLVSGQCLLFVGSASSGDPGCPDGSTLDDQGDCRKPVASAAGAYFCADPTAALNGTSCVFTAGFVMPCDQATGACGGEQEIMVCPNLPGVLTDAVTGNCYEQVSFASAACPDSTTPDTGTTLCRKPVSLEDQALACTSGYALVAGQCERYSEPDGLPDFDCADQGVGTDACNQVLASSQESPIDEFISQRPTMITYADCAGATGNYVVTASSGITVASGALAESPVGQYSASYTVPGGGTYTVAVTINCPDGETHTDSDELVFIDPSGIITDCSGEPVQGVVVTLLRADDTGELVAVADGDATIMDPSINVRNPSITDAAGFYRWDVVRGNYQVSAAVEGQEPVLSEVLPVPPARTDVDLVFESLNCPVPVQPTTAVNTGGPLRPILASQASTTSSSVASDTVVEPATSAPLPATSPLAVTGSESKPVSLVGLAIVGLGFTFAAAGRHRRRDL